MSLIHRPAALIILDGFGIAPPDPANAVFKAKKPFFDSLLNNYPCELLHASGLEVGLPEKEVGNSEVGHMTIGSGVLKYQSLPRIDKSISTGQFFKLPALLKVLEMAKKNKNKVHLIGLIGNGGVHSSQEHLEALINLCKVGKIKKDVYIHAFLDGRDTAKDLGKTFMEQLLAYCHKQKVGEIASVCGRFFGMDRNQNWDRTEKAYQAIVNGIAVKKNNDPLKAIAESYQQKVYDEEMEPVVITGKHDRPLATIENGDIVIFFNFRADRARQLSEAFIKDKFDKFKQRDLSKSYFVAFTKYEEKLPMEVLFPTEAIANPLARIISDYNLKQLHIAETEKYAHVTFFLNGTHEEPFPGEKRILVPSPNVISYDKKPEMSAFEVTKKILQSVKSDEFDFYAINYANPDMVGHTGNLSACIKAVEAVDKCLAQVVPAVVNKGGVVFIVGDHGNAEEMINPITKEVDKEHNHYPVPFLVVGNEFAGNPNKKYLQTGDLSILSPVGILADVAPTILGISGLDKAPEMTGTHLF